MITDTDEVARFAALVARNSLLLRYFGVGPAILGHQSRGTNAHDRENDHRILHPPRELPNLDDQGENFDFAHWARFLLLIGAHLLVTSRAAAFC
jgi:hypothetical protein